MVTVKQLAARSARQQVGVQPAELAAEKLSSRIPERGKLAKTGDLGPHSSLSGWLLDKGSWQTGE